jgi:hypothetical protein
MKKNQKRFVHRPGEQLLAQAEVTEADLEAEVRRWEETQGEEFANILRAELDDRVTKDRL